MSVQNSLDTVEHNLIVNDTVESREYQTYLSKEAGKESTLVVLPTGTGKTIVTLRITANQLLDNGGGTSLLLAPTKPLVEQHVETYKELLDISEDEIVMFTGDVRPDKREQIWNDEPSVVVATPQVIENDLISDRISMENVVHLTLDECHRATGDYSYVYIADKYVAQSDDPLITGLSASPGDSKEDILQICENINVSSLEVITEDDERIEPYLHETQIDTRFVDIDDEVLEVRDLLQDVYKDRLKKLYEDDFIDSRSKTVSMGKLHEARGSIQQAMQKGNDDAYGAMSIWAEAMKLNSAIEIIETQGVDSFIEYCKRLEEEMRSDDSSKAVQRLISDPTMQDAMKKAREYGGTYAKFDALRSELVRTTKIEDGKALVFTQSRDTVEALRDELDDDFGVARLVGQQDKSNSDGMSQTEQRDAIQAFGDEEYEVLLSTQVGEEGLDIPQVDLVVFYEPVARGIEMIQRQGRTGRSQSGRVVLLIGQDTRDVGMYYKSKNSIEQMEQGVEDLQTVEDLEHEIESELENQSTQATLGDTLPTETNDQGDKSESTDTDENVESDTNEEVKLETSSIGDDSDDTVTIIADSRETNSSVVRTLDVDEDVTVNVENNLEVGDYIVGNNCAVERKDVDDFHDTLTGGDRSLFEQIGELANAYDTPVLLIEGGHGKLYTKNIHQNAVRGTLASLVSDFGVSIIESVDEDDTASILKHLAQREQEDNDTTVNPHGRKKTATVADQQEYIVSSVEDIGPKTAERLLNHFGDIQSIVNSDIEELQDVEGVGEESAKKIFSIVRTQYN